MIIVDISLSILQTQEISLAAEIPQLDVSLNIHETQEINLIR